jgi:phosphocarrier protein
MPAMDAEPPAANAGGAAGGPESNFRRRATISNRLGLHARAAARFVKLAGSFDADITVTKGGQTVPGISILGLMVLAASPGDAIDIGAAGPEAEAAVRALISLTENKFEED